MVRHQDIGVQVETIPLLILQKAFEIGPKIPFIPEDRLPLVPPRQHMVEDLRAIDAWLASHAEVLPEKPLPVKK
jgi:hypothetical protein